MADSASNGSKAAAVGNGTDRRPVIIDPAVAAFVTDFFQYKLEKAGYQWKSTMPRATVSDAIHARAEVAMRSLADEFATLFKPQFEDMCKKMTISDFGMRYIFEGIADELFAEGINWTHIVALFVFGTELALYCKDKYPPSMIDHIAQALAWYISKKLATWIYDQGGWMGLVFERPLRREIDVSLKKILRRRSQ